MDFSFDAHQAILAAVHPDKSSKYLLLLPAYATVISACILLIQVITALRLHGPSKQAPGIGFGSILAWRIARFVSCLALLGVSVSVSVDEAAGAIRGVVVDGPYLYVTLLSLLSLNPKHYRQGLVRHANFVLFAASALYAYRDVVPLGTFTQKPLDYGAKMTAKIALVFFTGVIIPLFTPRLYIPVDPASPQKQINPEQTASIVSLAFYFFLDKIIFSAYRRSELPEDELYALCDTDRSAHLRQRSFKYLDVFSGAKPRYLFFGLMRVYWREFAILTVLVILRSIANYAGPFAMNRLLLYIETRDEVVQVARPWVWILLIGVGPLISSMAFQWYIYVNTRVLVRTESIITQLVFSHSLRIRMKADTTEAKEPVGEATTESLPLQADAERGTGAGGSDDETESATVQPSSTSVKSTTSSVKDKKKKDEDKPKGAKKDQSMGGMINNLVTTDLANIADGREFLVLLYIPCQLAIGIYFLYVLLGWSVGVGVASIVLLAPLPGYMANLVKKVQKERLRRTDERVSSVSEAVNVLRMVKLFGWESKMKDRILEKRDSELIWIRKRRVLELLSNVVNFLIPTLVMGQALTASKVFSSMTIFDFLRESIARITTWINQLMSAKVSLDRVDDFLRKTELLDQFDVKDSETTALFASDVDPASNEQIGFHNATFTWSKESDGSRSRSHRQFQLKIDDKLIFERGKINLIVGPTGSGKTSLLMALLGEMHFVPSSPESWFNLPRSGGVAYAAQESWVLNETIRENIAFDTTYDEERYKKVLYQCALEPDLELFQAGDQTEVGEKGLTLSGGQKARLTLARAVYSKASILLLDDVLAALDVHTAQWIVDKVFTGDLMKNRTVILVTHNIALASPIADFVVTFGSDGRIQAQGTVSEISKRSAVAAQIQEAQEVLDKEQQIVDPKVPEDSKPKSADGKLIVAEEIQMGHVSASALQMYFVGIGGKHSIMFFVLFYGGLFFNQSFVALRTWMLGHWAKQYDNRPAGEVDVVLNLTLFSLIALTSTTALSVVYIYLVVGQLRASKVIHQSLIESILTAPLRWLDVTPASRLLARVTSDVRAVDDALPNQMWHLSALIISMVVRFGAIVLYAPVFLFPGIAVGAFGAWMGQIYITSQLPVKRLMSKRSQSCSRPSRCGHSRIGCAVVCIMATKALLTPTASIRAFGAQQKFNSESLVRIDRYTRAARNFYNLNRWISIRVDVLGSLFGAGLAVYLVYIHPTSAGDAGFLLNMGLTVTQMLLWVVRILNEFEVEGNSLERIKAYIDIDHEKPATDAGKPPAYWPASGDLVVENLSARYSEDGPNVLHGISFHVKAGERVGIVGRTGSGKSSLTLSLLRCIPTDGSVRYDGLETSELNLDALRSSITIIPQVPELLSGTLRSNLDPFGQHDDAELNSALRAAGLFTLQGELDEAGRITLDSAISAGGSNLSVGQRQIFALARAIVRKSKILILDEGKSLLSIRNLWLSSFAATSAIDYKTDAIIQNSLRQELQGDVSLLTVAHRLQTIMDAHKIMVLDGGKIVEYASPKELLKIEGGKLRALVDESGDREILYAMAGAMGSS
ncbi:P-loop containing nucleoside triphosphate hydrolase protein [Mycena amicta]|nr:P-loop containing nucleoside triphosphate hydrolase protein [Mycena amicta]